MLDFGIKVIEVEKRVIEIISQRKMKTDINQNRNTDKFWIIKT